MGRESCEGQGSFEPFLEGLERERERMAHGGIHFAVWLLQLQVFDDSITPYQLQKLARMALQESEMPRGWAVGLVTPIWFRRPYTRLQ